MLHVVLHVHVTAAQDFKTEGTQQLFSVFMDRPEMCLHIREEGRSVIADLWGWEGERSVPAGAAMEARHKADIRTRPGTRKAFPRVCDPPSCAPTGPARTRRPAHIFYSWLKREPTFQIRFGRGCFSPTYGPYLDHTGGFDSAVGALDVALQLEWRHVLAIAMLAGRVAFPALAVLLLQLQMVLHVVHEPAGHTQ